MAIYNSRGDGGHAPSNDRRCPPSLSCVSGSAQPIARIRNACVGEAPAAARPRRSRVRTGGRATDRDGGRAPCAARWPRKKIRDAALPSQDPQRVRRRGLQESRVRKEGGATDGDSGRASCAARRLGKESETPRCQAKGLARPQGRGRTRALTAGAMGSGVGQRNGVASADASVATADRVAFPRVCCPRLRPSSPADSPSSSRYPSPALR